MRPKRIDGIASAPAKAILLGEHAVVYGEPAIAVPIPDLRASAYYRSSDSPLTIQGGQLPRRIISLAEADARDPIARIIMLAAERCGADKLCGEIKLESDIPIASGLGSGAAVSAALGRAVAALSGSALSDDALNDIVFEVEKLHHGSPSGIDNSVVVHESPVCFIKGKPIEYLKITKPMRLLLADSGIQSSTRETVAAVRALRDERPTATQEVIREIGRIASQGRDALLAGDHMRLGALMTANHKLLRQLTVSAQLLDRIVEAALAAGAIGAKLSGGGRGGHVIALVDNVSERSVRPAMLQAGAKSVFASTIGGESAT